MKRLLFVLLILFQGLDLMASDPLNVDAKDDGAGIYPVVLASIMLVSAVIVRLITISRHAKSGKL